MRKLERDIKNEILLSLSKDPSVRVFNQPQGIGYVGTVVEKRPGLIMLADWRIVTFGMAPGSSDLIGWTQMEITEEMLGSVFARFTAIEIKQERGRLTTAQENFLKVVKRAGGIAGVARSPKEAWELIE